MHETHGRHEEHPPDVAPAVADEAPAAVAAGVPRAGREAAERGGGPARDGAELGHVREHRHRGDGAEARDRAEEPVGGLQAGVPGDVLGDRLVDPLDVGGEDGEHLADAGGDRLERAGGAAFFSCTSMRLS